MSAIIVLTGTAAVDALILDGSSARCLRL